MSQSEDPKMGETVKYNIGGKEVRLAPAPLKKTKEAFNQLVSGPDDVFDRLRNAATILLSGENDFVNSGWVEENMNMPQVSKLIEDARRINGLGADGFFAKGSETRELTEKEPTP